MLRYSDIEIFLKFFDSQGDLIENLLGVLVEDTMLFSYLVPALYFNVGFLFLNIFSLPFSLLLILPKSNSDCY